MSFFKRMQLGNPPHRRMMVFIDGENLTFNYQSTLRANPHFSPTSDVNHLEDTYVWHPSSIYSSKHEILRASYYTFAVGAEERINAVCKQIKSLSFHSDIFSILPSNLKPLVFKKDKQGKKSKGVDIQLTVDILTNVYYDNTDTILLITGDGDFLPIIREISHAGKQVFLASFKSGLNEALINYVDYYYELDQFYFKKNEVNDNGE